MGLWSWYKKRKAAKKAAEDAYWDHVWGDDVPAKSMEHQFPQTPTKSYANSSLGITGTCPENSGVGYSSNDDMTNLLIVAALINSENQAQQPSPEVSYSQPAQQVETNSTPQDTPVSSSDPVTTMPLSSYDTPSSYDSGDSSGGFN